MPHSATLVPEDNTHRDVYLVLTISTVAVGRGARPTRRRPDRATLIRNLINEQYENPVRIVAFNTTEGWSRDVTIDIADELRRRFVEFREVPDSILDFVEANRR